MRIHEVEIYTSKQIDAFIEYLKVLSTEKKAMEAMQSMYAPSIAQGSASLGNTLYAQKAAADIASQINQGSSVG